ncbi:tol-pal system YbgF family protein [Gemmatimonadota bacterium]
MLRPKKHITRQKIKEDKFVTKTLIAVAWLKKNQKRLTFAGLGIILGGIILWGSASARKAAEEEASLLTLMGGYALEQQDFQQARTFLLQAAEGFGRVPSAGRATFMLGQVFFRLGAIDTSQSYYQRYLDRYARIPLLKAAARAGISACQEELGNFTPAAEGYKEAARFEEGHPEAAHYLLQAARCYRLANNVPAAITLYEQLKIEFPESAEADRASIETAQLAQEGG